MDIGIIAPYHVQFSKLRKALKDVANDVKNRSVEVVSRASLSRLRVLLLNVIQTYFSINSHLFFRNVRLL
jgi:hypothetical protein